MSLLWSILRQAVRRRGEVAVVDDRRKWRYGDLLGGSMFLAEAIEATTSARQVGLLLPTSGAFVAALLGTWMARRAVVPLNYLLARDELAYVIADSGIDTVLTVGPMLDFIGGPEVIPAGVRVVKLEDLDYTGFPPLRWPPLPRSDELAALLYTSGTSAKPKGVMLTHGNLECNVRASIAHARINEGNCFLGVLPQFHSFGLTALTLVPLAAGSRVVYAARFVPKKIVELIREERPDVVMFVPSMYGALLSVKEATAADFSSIVVAISGGEPLPNAVLEEFTGRFNVMLLEGYGLTETSPVLTWSTPWATRPHSVGTALPGVSVLIVDEDGRPTPTGRDGEILVAGPSIMKGYYRLPEQTRAVFVEMDVADQRGERGARRWFRTGDIGHVDAEGFVYITGRKKEMLKVAGEIVFPREIEEVLNQHPAVRASAVIGKVDGLRGEVPFAFVEVCEGERFDETALRSFCRERLAGYKVPRTIRAVDALPRNPTGKVLKRQLRADD